MPPSQQAQNALYNQDIKGQSSSRAQGSLVSLPQVALMWEQGCSPRRRRWAAGQSLSPQQPGTGAAQMALQFHLKNEVLFPKASFKCMQSLMQTALEGRSIHN